MAGATAVVEAVVVGAFPDLPEGLGGFFLQEEDDHHDGDPLTSEGLFVYEGDLAAPLELRIGDVVRVRGQAGEFFGMTELSRVEAVALCPQPGVATPVVLELPAPEVDPSGPSFWERFEGMAVRIAEPLVVVDQYAAGRFGEIELAAGGRLWQSTQHADPGPEAVSWHAADERRLLLLDDGSTSVDPDPWPHLETEEGRILRLGDRATSLEGVLDFAFGRFRIQPTGRPRFASASVTPTPPELLGAMRVVAWNVENLFNGDGHGGGFPTRGAASPGEYARQLAKVAATLVTLRPDVMALVELENDGAGEDGTLADLARAMAVLAPEDSWKPVDPGGAVGDHAIAVGLLFRPATIAPLGPAAVLDEGAHPDFDSTRNRPSLAQTFRHRATRQRVTVVVNHLKSKGSSCAVADDPDRGDGQGNCNGTRTRAARALAEWVAGDPTASDGAPALVVGDLNAYPREDPIAELTAAGLVDLLALSDSPDAYSFVFDGRAGRLDHAFASASLVPEVGGAAVWNVNADTSPALGYGGESPPALYRTDPLRASDHDPVIVGLYPVPEPSARSLAVAALAVTWLLRRHGQRAAIGAGLR